MLCLLALSPSLSDAAGLQKTLAKYNDVRQAGVSWDATEALLKVNLLAATHQG